MFDMDNATRLSADNRFSIIPHWVIFSGISSGAIHLYAVLAKYADNDTGQAFPARSRLASDLGKSVDTIDRTAKELVEAGALKVTRRKRAGSSENYSNLYTLITANPNAAEVPEMIEVDPEEVAARVRPGSRTDAAVTKPTELHPHSFTSDASAPDQQEPFTSNKSDTLARPSEAQPRHNPGELNDGQRKTLRDQLVVMGKMLENGHTFYSPPIQEHWDTFTGMIEDAFTEEFDMQFADLLHNGKWTLSTKVATAYGAGAELNKLINTARNQ